jgi:hypothetical protein
MVRYAPRDCDVIALGRLFSSLENMYQVLYK